MRTSTGKPTKSEADRMAAFPRVGCVACYLRGRYSEPQAHHLLSGNKRRGHRYTIPLCPAHHQGIDHDPELHGPSLAKQSKLFHITFGSDAELLSLADMLIEDGMDRRL